METQEAVETDTMISGEKKEVPKKFSLRGIPKRFDVGIMCFVACFMAYMLRSNFSVSILAMVEAKTNETVKDFGPRYAWSPGAQSHLIGAYFYGYVVSSLPGGIIAERFGGRQVIGVGTLFCGVLTALMPLSASLGFVVTFANRFLTGVMAGIIYPAIHTLIAKWAPPNEKGKFVTAFMGGTFGTVVTFPMCGAIIETMGWVWSFYVPGILSLLIGGLWYYLVYNTPAENPRISEEERHYIEECQGGTVSNKKALPPVGPLLCSLPFWALVILHYGNLWGLYFLITAAPKFMKEVLHFGLTKSGGLASLPYLARLVAGLIFGQIGDTLKSRNLMSTTTIRKFFVLFSHIIPGLFLVLIAYVYMGPYACVAVITLSLGFNGASTLTSLQNAQDLSPNFAGTIYGAMNFVGTTSGFLSPLIVGYFTAEESTLETWSNVFLIGAAVYIIPSILFMVIGSGNVQSWNTIKKGDDNETAEKSIVVKPEEK